MHDLKELGVYSAIADYLEKNLGKNDGVLELRCGDGGFAEYLNKKGFKNYHGIDNDSEKIKAAKARVKSFSKRFHTKEGKYKRDIIVCLHGTPYENIETGQRLVVLTSGFPDYDSVCLAITGLFQEGANTVQHGDLFVTYGTRA